jgi:hypothetical protein
MAQFGSFGEHGVERLAGFGKPERVQQRHRLVEVVLHGRRGPVIAMLRRRSRWKRDGKHPQQNRGDTLFY